MHIFRVRNSKDRSAEDADEYEIKMAPEHIITMPHPSNTYGSEGVPQAKGAQESSSFGPTPGVSWTHEKRDPSRSRLPTSWNRSTEESNFYMTQSTGSDFLMTASAVEMLEQGSTGSAFGKSSSRGGTFIEGGETPF